VLPVDGINWEYTSTELLPVSFPVLGTSYKPCHWYEELVFGSAQAILLPKGNKLLASPSFGQIRKHPLCH
jgi:hypothetical protein